MLYPIPCSPSPPPHARALVKPLLRLAARSRAWLPMRVGESSVRMSSPVSHFLGWWAVSSACNHTVSVSSVRPVALSGCTPPPVDSSVWGSVTRLTPVSACMNAAAWDQDWGNAVCSVMRLGDRFVSAQVIAPQWTERFVCMGLNLRLALGIFKFRDRSFKLRGHNRTLFLQLSLHGEISFVLLSLKNEMNYQLKKIGQ